jgi:FKBP-type peptidyl-prolyl cis-trans isomerase SlyD
MKLFGSKGRKSSEPAKDAAAAPAHGEHACCGGAGHKHAAADHECCGGRGHKAEANAGHSCCGGHHHGH